MQIILGSIPSRPTVTRLLAGAALLLTAAGPAAGHADAGVYQTPETFVAESFPDGAPDARALWLRADLRRTLSDLLERPAAPRVRYWERDGQTVWVLEEVGKDEPITAGVVVENGAIRDIRVLVFRESRGWEVKHPFFTRQFQDARLTRDGGLNQHIDGITGATLSVRAMTKMARVALLLDAHTRQHASDLARAPSRTGAQR